MITEMFILRVHNGITFRQIAERFNADPDRYPPPVPHEGGRRAAVAVAGRARHARHPVVAACGASTPAPLDPSAAARQRVID
ncbi:hypothetical protein, partial [Catellatospora sp. NPDC049609]|uniref:hypothetical protein n=1 Tax=Catellatospora sp. NPDC049609 TaxID=3155505 RepID=UPI00341BC772